jgi:glycosyltransferase involved in cell wall biosynthesis
MKLIQRKPSNGKVTIVIPCYNEEKNINRTLEGLLNEAKDSQYDFEIIAVNDGSKDDTWSVIDKYAQKHHNIKGINQMGNFGQSQAYQAGFDAATGDYVLICSADLETPLKNIHKVIEYLDEGYDFVNTNRVGRWGGDRAVKSSYANKIIKEISGIEVVDRGSGMKGMTTQIAKSLNLYGEMHRFLPDYASVYGAKIKEFETDFKDRDAGVSAYRGHKRTIKVLLDLVTLGFMLYFARKPFSAMPGRLFGFTGSIMAVIGLIITVSLITEKILFAATLADRPLFTLSIFMLILGVIMMMLGTLGELLMRIYFESTGRKPYMIRNTVNL